MATPAIAPQAPSAAVAVAIAVVPVDALVAAGVPERLPAPAPLSPSTGRFLLLRQLLI